MLCAEESTASAGRTSLLARLLDGTELRPGTITGTGLGDFTDVTFGGVPATIVETPPDTRVTVTTPAGAVGAVEVALTYPTGTAVAENAYSYLPVPVVTDLDPATGPAIGGMSVTVIGDEFIPGGTTVTLCGVTIAPADVTVSEDGTSLMFTTPPCEAGDATITITTAGGAGNGDTFQCLPVAGAATGGDTGSIRGSGSGGTGALAFTTSDPRPGMIAAAALLLLGSVLAAVGYRRRRSV